LYKCDTQQNQKVGLESHISYPSPLNLSKELLAQQTAVCPYNKELLL